MIIGYFLNYIIHEYTLIIDLKNDIVKKTGKFGKKTSTKGFTTINLTEFLDTPPSFPIGTFKSGKNKGNNNYNNYIKSNTVAFNNNNNVMNESNISKLYLKDSNNNTFIKKGIKIKHFSFFDILCNKVNFKPNQSIRQMLNIRMKVLSEEKLITEYYVIGMISDVVLKKGQNNIYNNCMDMNPKSKIDSYVKKKNTISIPQNRLFLSNISKK
jgi:hypothetical protein